jgi:hypothetical protein
MVTRFRVGQKWISAGGKLHGTVTEVSDDGRSGVVVITDDQGQPATTHRGTVAEFQGAGQWHVVAE